MLYAETDRLKIPTPWYIRNDVHNVVVYKIPTTEEPVYKVLSPLEASIVPFFDGKIDIAEIKKIWFKIHDYYVDKKELLQAFHLIVENLLKCGILSKIGNLTDSLKNLQDGMTPDFADYHYPAKRLERPISVNIAFTNLCNANCRYCYAQRYKCKEVDISCWKLIFDELVANQVFHTDIGGGDIFCRSDALDILAEMVIRGFVFSISTKSYISPQIAEKLYQLNIGRSDASMVQVSIDSADEEVASNLTRCPEYLKKITQTVKNLINIDVKPRIKCVITGFNVDAPEKLINYFARLGVTEFNFVQYGRSYYSHCDDLFIPLKDKDSLRDKFKTFQEEYRELNITYQDSALIDTSRQMTWEKWKDRSLCAGGRSNMFIQPNGDVTLCEQIPHASAYVIGNVFEKRIIEIWKSNELDNFLYPNRNLFINSVCYNCHDFSICHEIKGYCYREALFAYGSIYDAPPECPRQDKLPPRNQ